MLNDNDAGGRLAYINYTKRTGMLEKIRHYNASTYNQLMNLDADFINKGSLYQYIRDTFGLSQRQLRMLVDNTRSAASILRDSCKKGKLRFDLDFHEYLLKGSVMEKKPDCG